MIEAKYKKDPQKAAMERLKLMREKGVGLGGGAILPLLLQLPFLFAVYEVLKTTFELRGASFIPHWIPDLTAPDVLFSWKYPIFFFGTQFHPEAYTEGQTNRPSWPIDWVYPAGYTKEETDGRRLLVNFFRIADVLE